ncbi:MAG: prepilin-type N-terminal cleavage/methylation domain-containing protein [Verrucomicrobiia bacterium]
MTSRTGSSPISSARPHRSRSERDRRDAFTLIELILVLAVLSVVIALGAPTLSRFFRGRTIEEEGQRLLALTRYGQSRAVSECLPMVLWMNPADGTYGVRVQDGYNAGDAKSQTTYGSGNLSGVGKDVRFQLPDRLRFELEQGGRIQNQMANIRFAPDGSIDENSLHRVVIRQDDGDWTAIVQSENQLNYVIDQKTDARTTVSR